MICERCQGTGHVVQIRSHQWQNAGGRKGGYWKRVNEPCPDCIGGIASCCEVTDPEPDPPKKDRQ